MKAVGYVTPLAIDHPNALVDLELAPPTPGPRDLLVDVRAVSVNPVDYKIRSSRSGSSEQPVVLGWDAAGVVVEVGSAVTLFKPGDRVWYAGDITRPGTNAERHVVDERIVGHMPKSLGFTDAAALPLTAITAWELLFDRLGLAVGKAQREQRLLVIGAAGGVGSILVQLARRLTSATIIGTASRDETRDWALGLGAHHVINHRQPLSAGLKAIGIDTVTHVASLTHTDAHFDQIVDVLAPQGKLGLIDDPPALDVSKLKRKSASLHWELMFTRSLYGTDDLIAQHHLLNEVAALVDEGLLRTTVGENLGPINAANLRKAHALLESGTAKGKIVLEGF